MVARLTPDQKVACSSHVGVTGIFFSGGEGGIEYGLYSYFVISTVVVMATW